MKIHFSYLINIRSILRHIFNNVIYLFATLIIIFLIVPVWLYDSKNGHPFPEYYRIFTQMSLAVWGGLFTSLYFSWILYLLRNVIRRYFGLPKPLNLRMPLMIATSPLILASKYKIFEKNDLDIDFDFRYAGISALQDLHDGKCDLAVASDIAIISYMSDNFLFKVNTLPFVKISNHIKLLVKNPQINTISDLSNKKVACLAKSVHRHFIDRINDETNIKLDPLEANGILECYTLVNTGQADACISWEPYYLTMINKFGLREISVDFDYEWYLCLVAKTEFVNSNRAYEKNIYRTLKEATLKCKSEYVSIAENCITYMHPEFTGLSEDNLDSLLNSRDSYHEFKIDISMKNSFIIRLTKLFNTNVNDYKFAKDISENLWPSFDNLS